MDDSPQDPLIDAEALFGPDWGNGERLRISLDARHHRIRIIDAYRARPYALSEDERIAYRSSHEALADAVDVEHLPGGMPAQDVSGEDAELAINSFTNRLLA
jgi:hypothetical protein